MATILVIKSGRADGTPLNPVIYELEAVGHKVDVLDLASTPPEACIRKTQRALTGHHLMMVLGDRFEVLAACVAATIAGVPIGHIHGGEASFGSFDNQARDAISKLSHIHFVAGEPMRKRLLALGEVPSRIFVVGAPGLDNLIDVLTTTPRKRGGVLLTYHPATLVDESVTPLVSALARFTRETGEQLSWTEPNVDPGAKEIFQAFYAAFGPPAMLRARQYHVAMREATVVIGNSSSGIIEAPYLEVPSVDVGQRQAGRLRGGSVFTAKMDVDAVLAALDSAMNYSGRYINPYGQTGASEKIVRVLATNDVEKVKTWFS